MTTSERRTGAKAQTFSARNPRELLVKSVKAASHGNRELLLVSFKKELKKSSADYFDAIVDYWFSNNLTAIGADEDFPVNTRFTAEKRGKAGNAEVVSINASVTLAATRTPEQIEEHLAAMRKRKQDGIDNANRLKAEAAARIDAGKTAAMPAAISVLSKYCKVVLMSMATPLGKPLCECTGEECLTLGGWYATVGTMAGDGALVGDVLTETDLQAALSGAVE